MRSVKSNVYLASEDLEQAQMIADKHWVNNSIIFPGYPNGSVIFFAGRLPAKAI
jgi:hypothetical protein